MNLKGKIISVALAAALVLGSVGAEVTLTDISVSAASSAKLAAPKNFKAKSKTSSSITLSWSKVSGAAKYRIYKYSLSKKKWVRVKDVKKTTYTVKNLDTYTTYKFKICALKKTDEGKYAKQKSSKILTVKTSIPDGYIVGAEVDFEYEENDTGITVTKYNGNVKNLVIPDTIGGKSVTMITGWFDESQPESLEEHGFCENCTGVVIPDSVTYIGFYAFFGCKSLASVAIPSSVTSFGDHAFDGTPYLTSITKNGIAVINNNVVKCDATLTNVTIPDGVTKIANYAFKDCFLLEEVTIPDGVTEIGYCAFSNCDSLKSVTLPDSMKIIDERAFLKCAGLTSITLPHGVTRIGVGAFIDCESLADVIIPSSVTEIGKYAFYGCTSLSSVAIPDSVTKIGDYTFSRCESLVNISIPSSVTEIGEFAFCECTSLANVEIPDGVAKISRYAFCDCTSLVNVTIPDSVTKIGFGAFSGCKSIQAAYKGEVYAYGSIKTLRKAING